MRPPSHRQDPLRSPLNEILGSEGAVRVLRVLARSRAPIARAQVARRAELNPSGVRRILDRLGELGLVDAVGSGRNQVVSLRDRHPLAAELRQLFQTEHDQFEHTVDGARRLLTRNPPPATAVWIESPSVRTPGTVDIGVLAEPRGRLRHSTSG